MVDPRLAIIQDESATFWAARPAQGETQLLPREVGFTKAELLQLLNSIPTGAIETRYTTGYLNVRKRPSAKKDVEVLRVLDVGVAIRTRAEITHAEGYSWQQLEDGSGWIAIDFTRLKDGSGGPQPATKRAGMNIDLMYDDTRPDPIALSGIKYARFVYNVSRAAGGYGNVNVEIAHNRFGGYIAGLIGAGITPILVMDHQMFGEGAGYNWNAMSAADWNRLRADYINILGEVVKRYATNIVIQIWNEPDQTSLAAVGLPPGVFARFLDDAVDTVQAFAPSIKVIPGGLVSGDLNYWRTTSGQMRNAKKLAGLAVHPYGHVPDDGINYKPTLGVIFGKLKDLTAAYGAIAPSGKLWFTEWGVTGDASRHEPPNVPESSAARYIKAFVGELHSRVQAACYYAWRDGQHSTLGIIKRDGERRNQMWQALIA